MTRTIALVMILAAVFVAGALLLGGPFVSYWKGRTADAEAGQEHATDDAAARGLEVQGTRQLGEAASDLQSAAANMRSAANALDDQARQDPAATGDLAPSVLERIRAHDRELCASGLRCPDTGPAAAP